MTFLLILNLICFIWPFLLTLRLLNGTYCQNRLINKNNEQIRFLLNYWICYIFVNYLHELVLSKTTFWFGADFVVTFTKVWLFYCHGCLVINYCYVGRFLRKIIHEDNSDLDPFEELDVKFLSPLMRIVLMNNHFIPNISKLLSTSGKGNGIVGWFFNGIVQFRQCFIRSVDKSFLQFSLEYVCYMDSWDGLTQKFKTTDRILHSGVLLIQRRVFHRNFQEDSLQKLIQLIFLPNSDKDDQLYYISIDDEMTNPITGKMNTDATCEKLSEYELKKRILEQKESINKTDSTSKENYMSLVCEKEKYRSSKNSKQTRTSDKIVPMHESSIISNPFLPVKWNLENFIRSTQFSKFSEY